MFLEISMLFFFSTKVSMRYFVVYDTISQLAFMVGPQKMLSLPNNAEHCSQDMIVWMNYGLTVMVQNMWIIVNRLWLHDGISVVKGVEILNSRLWYAVHMTEPQWNKSVLLTVKSGLV